MSTITSFGWIWQFISVFSNSMFHTGTKLDCHLFLFIKKMEGTKLWCQNKRWWHCGEWQGIGLVMFIITNVWHKYCLFMWNLIFPLIPLPSYLFSSFTIWFKPCCLHNGSPTNTSRSSSSSITCILVFISPDRALWAIYNWNDTTRGILADLIYGQVYNSMVR